MGVLLCVMLGGLGLNGMGGALEAGFFNDGLNLRSTEVGVRSFRHFLDGPVQIAIPVFSQVGENQHITKTCGVLFGSPKPQAQNGASGSGHEGGRLKLERIFVGELLLEATALVLSVPHP